MFQAYIPFATAVFLGTALIATIRPALAGREWTSKGGVTFEAELVRVHRDIAILKRADDGKEMVVPVSKLSAEDQEFINNRTVEVSGKKASGVQPIVKELEGTLTKLSGDGVAKAELADAARLKYLAVYFSARWCAPCREFTPELIDFYNEEQKDHPDFDLVFVSCDRNTEEWKRYMLESRMPWYAVSYDNAKSTVLRKYAGPGIPCLVLMNPEGEVISDSYVNGRYTGPRQVLKDLRRLLSSRKTTEVASESAPVKVDPVKGQLEAQTIGEMNR